MWKICLNSKGILLAVLSKRKAEVETDFNLSSDPFRQTRDYDREWLRLSLLDAQLAQLVAEPPGEDVSICVDER